MSGQLDSLIGDKTLEKKRNRMLSDLRRDIGLRLLYLAPSLGFVEMKNEALADFTGLSTEAVANSVLQFLQVGLWIQDEEGSIRLAEKIFLRVGDSSPREHLASTIGIISNLSEYGPCWYESSVVATSQELKKEFYTSVRDAFRAFVKKSGELERFDSVVAWSHQGFDCRKGWNRIHEEEDHVH